MKTCDTRRALQASYTNLDRAIKHSPRKDKLAYANSIAFDVQKAAETNVMSIDQLGSLLKDDDDGTLITAKDAQLELWADHYVRL